LLLDLKRLEAAKLRLRGYDYEVIKHVSLSAANLSRYSYCGCVGTALPSSRCQKCFSIWTSHATTGGD
jgi:hypothetical protein